MSAALYGTSFIYPTNSAASSHTLQLPLYSSGNLLLAFISSTNAASASITGWTELFAVNRVSGSGQDRLTCLYRVSDGTEGTSASIALSASENVAAVCYSISRYSGGSLSYATTTGNTDSPDPPSLSPAGGSAEYLWFAAFASTGARYPTAYSSGYHVAPQLLYNGLGASTARTILGTCGSISVNSSQNPGAFTISSSFQWVAATVTVPLVSVGGIRQVNIRGGADQ